MAIYTITALGRWPTASATPATPYVGEMFSVTRNGESARNVIASVPLADLHALQIALRSAGMSDPDAQRAAGYALRQLGAEQARRWAEARSLRTGVGDAPLEVPVELGGVDRVIFAGGLIRYEPGTVVAGPFEIDD